MTWYCRHCDTRWDDEAPARRALRAPVVLTICPPCYAAGHRDEQARDCPRCAWGVPAAPEPVGEGR